MGTGSASIATRSKKLGPSRSGGIGGSSTRAAGSAGRGGSRCGGGSGRRVSAVGAAGASATGGSAGPAVDFSSRKRYSSRSLPSGVNNRLSVTLISFFSFATSDCDSFLAARDRCCEIMPETPDLQKLVDLVARRRAPDGCPWHREQTLPDVRAYLLEEAHELAGAIDAGDWEELAEELGDLLFQAAFIGRLAEESAAFSLSQVIDGVYR